MVQYNFKKMTVVPNGKDFIDIILSRTQRQTPTVVHKGCAISSLRGFYMRKVKFTEDSFQKKLSTIIDEFPRLDDFHPFYGDLLHVLYNKDHYKLALGQINTARNLIGKICNTWQGYLRLTKTLLICGYPNVGKSSFINKITRADVDVQPYAFTTKSLFVGHTDYKYLRYQVIDTPGILDRPFEDRNIIEMCSITALAHLGAAVLFFLDISGSCGYSIAQQAALFHSIKQEVGMEMKADAMKTTIGLGGEATNDEGVLLTMSTLTEEGVIAVKNAACERLLNQRVESKMKSKKINDRLNRFHVAMPKPRDNKERSPCIPLADLEAKAKQAAGKEKRNTEKDLENENGGAGVYSASLKKNYILANDEWKEDAMPEILDGHNVYDFVVPDILLRLEELEQEERRRQAEGDNDFEMNGLELTTEVQKTLAEIRKKKSLLIQQHRIKKSTAESRPTVPRKSDKDREFTTKRMGRQLSKLGLDPTMAINRVRSRSVSTRGRRRKRSLDMDDTDGGDAVDMDTPNKKQCMLSRSCSRSRSWPQTEVVPGEGFKDSAQKARALQRANKSNKMRNRNARRGEADRVIPTLKPKHLFSGKRSIGKIQRR
ncbi:unnamed protein product [Prunus armeniaca]|uniref:Nucleolar GTP-binding protein 1 n=1 Tax=Prunus armeniaca TaxID=36596 RepID=A0A6J5XPE1_PRUAR|nr:unnamed protein product [Prunus armeniaca]